VFLLWAFAPLAWFLMWRDKKYHTWFPKLLWINGIIFGVIFITQSVIAIPRLNAIYEALSIHIPSYVHPSAVGFVILFALAQIYAGHKLEQKVKVKKHFPNNYILPIVIIFAIDGILGFATGFLTTLTPARFLKPAYEKIYAPFVESTPTPTAQSSVIDISKYLQTPTTSPTPKPLSFTQMDEKYGPCVTLPTLVYHHVEDLSIAKKNNRLGLSVSPEAFTRHLAYLADNQYKTIEMKDLKAFFDNGTPIPAKSVLITFDDAYQDIYENAYPLLRAFGMKGTVFTPTGLIGNDGYLTWEQIAEMNDSGTMLFANHTWSHKSMFASNTEVTMEIETADRELRERNLGNPKIFAYPYGTVGKYSETELKKRDYTIAFTTQQGRVLCKKQALTLPRVRVQNESLESYGF